MANRNPIFVKANKGKLAYATTQEPEPTPRSPSLEGISCAGPSKIQKIHIPTGRLSITIDEDGPMTTHEHAAALDAKLKTLQRQAGLDGLIYTQVVFRHPATPDIISGVMSPAGATGFIVPQNVGAKDSGCYTRRSNREAREYEEPAVERVNSKGERTIWNRPAEYSRYEAMTKAERVPSGSSDNEHVHREPYERELVQAKLGKKQRLVRTMKRVGALMKENIRDSFF